MGENVRRRDFIVALGASACSFRAVAQSSVPVVGFLNSVSPVTYRFTADTSREGLAQAGFVEGRNVRIEERWANADYNALPRSPLTS
jgi:putative ABC transport system substrate-binding protein